MRGLRTRLLWSLLLCCVAAGLPAPGVAAADAPSVQALLAEQDAELVASVANLDANEFQLPAELVLDPELRESAAQLAREHAARLRVLLPDWIAEERGVAKDPLLRGPRLYQAIFARAINELAIQSVESAGPAHDQAWLKAALAPNACRVVYGVPFARRVAMIQAAPVEARPALLAGEKELLSRWGTKRQALAPRPSTAELAEADHAITRLREGLPVTAAPMSPALAWELFALSRKPGKPNVWERCVRSQWWLQSQLGDGKTDPSKALAIYRYSRLADVANYVPPGYQAAPAAVAGKPAHPRVASFYGVQGTIVMLVDTDEGGHAFKADVFEREIKVPGVRDNPPLAFETLLDDASTAFALQRTYPEGKAEKRKFGVQWNLGKEDDHAR